MSKSKSGSKSSFTNKPSKNRNQRSGGGRGNNPPKNKAK